MIEFEAKCFHSRIIRNCALWYLVKKFVWICSFSASIAPKFIHLSEFVILLPNYQHIIQIRRHLFYLWTAKIIKIP